MSRVLATLSVLLLPALAHAHGEEWPHHFARKLLVREYDPVHHDLVLVIEGERVVLDTQQAVVFGNLRAGRLVDVAWDDEADLATRIVVRPERARAAFRP